ncbi:putative acetyltransferase [Legionella pneumophila]|uniref:GNAT family N-acetyltransferase n=1 Tax=Legionella pneumophila TaxID=446 RepID=UPI000770B594|nr:GNAT family N-acetyltransferase [Legionella pneumophila]CZH01717.1 putative acetyltransferase [Legionella pneumophila]
MKLTYESEPRQEDIDFLSQGISEYAYLKKGQQPIETFAFFVRDADEVIIGGCNGSMYYGCLYIDQLWVDERYRKQGIGKQLIEKSEFLGKQKQCRFSTINTMDWEALGFYQKLGYQVEFQREGYKHHSTLYFLIKEFNNAAKSD